MKAGEELGIRIVDSVVIGDGKWGSWKEKTLK
jgi:DNA repair protein RadC